MGLPGFGIQGFHGSCRTAPGEVPDAHRCLPAAPQPLRTPSPGCWIKGGFCSVSSSREDTTSYKPLKSHPVLSFRYVDGLCPLKLPAVGWEEHGGKISILPRPGTRDRMGIAEGDVAPGQEFHSAQGFQFGILGQGSRLFSDSWSSLLIV